MKLFTNTLREHLNLIDLVQRTDLSYAQMMEQLEEETQAFTARMQALYDSFNDNFPLYSEEIGAIAGENFNPQMGGVTDKWKLNRLDDLTDITFMERKMRESLQIKEYKEMYGKTPTQKDLDNLFFLTDVRLDGKEEILSVKQHTLSENLYTLASLYPEYYKLDEKHVLGTKEYNGQLKKIVKQVNKDYKDLSKTGNQNIKDAVLNGIVEQSIYEIKGRPNHLNEMNINDVYKFTTSIQNVVSNTFTPDSKDDEIMKEHKDIKDVISLTTVGLNGSGSTVKLGAEYRSLFIYDKELKLLGKGSDAIAYSDKYYLSAKELDVDADSDEQTTTTAKGTEPTSKPATVAPDNVNNNPNTGR